MCDLLDIGTAVRTYMMHGWEEMARSYLMSDGTDSGADGRCAKRTVRTAAREGFSRSDQVAMELMAKAREYIVLKLFTCCSGPCQELIAYGSSNVTSDYDVTLIGANSPETMWRMVQSYLETYGHSLSTSLDCNVYTVGLYAQMDSVEDVPGLTKLAYVSRGMDVFTLLAESRDASDTAVEYACLKVLENGFETHLPQERATSTLLATLEEQRRSARAHAAAKYASYSSEVQETVASYILQYKYAKRLFRILYGANEDEVDAYPHFQVDTGDLSAMEILCRAKYFSIEATYTQACVNVVVLEIQDGQDLALPKSEYLCSLIENFGDIVRHLRRSDLDLRSNILKCSKYVYRMLYSTWKGCGDRRYHAMASDAKEVVRRRSDPAHSVDLTPVLRFSTASAGMTDSDLDLGSHSVADYIGVVHALFQESLVRFADSNGVIGGGMDQPESRYGVPSALSIGCMIATAAVTLATMV